MQHEVRRAGGDTAVHTFQAAHLYLRSKFAMNNLKNKAKVRTRNITRAIWFQSQVFKQIIYWFAFGRLKMKQGRGCP